MKCVQLVDKDTEEDLDEKQCAMNGTKKPAVFENCNDFPCAAEWFAHNFGEVCVRKEQPKMPVMFGTILLPEKLRGIKM